MQTEEQQDVDDDQLAQPAEPQLTPLGQLTPAQGFMVLQLVQTEEQQDVEDDQLAHPAEPQLTAVGQVTPSQGSVSILSQGTEQ